MKALPLFFMEKWKSIPNYDGLYEVSSYGRIRNVRRQTYLKYRVNHAGYARVHLSKNCNVKDFSVHRLVAEAFIPNPDKKSTVNHKDENKLNNCVDNLEWLTVKENINHGTCVERTHTKQRKQVLCVETNIIYPSVMSLAKEFGYNFSLIARVCRGERKSAYGYRWKYI